MADLVKHVDFVTVFVDDFDQAMEFYGSTLGLERGPKYGQLDGQEFETGNLTLSVMRSEAIGIPFAPSGHPIALQVDDVHAAREALEAKGVEFHGEVIDSGVCHMSPFRDPAGNALMLHHRYAPRD